MTETTKPKLASGRSARWAFMERFDAPDYEHPERAYLTRWRVVQTPWFGVYVHRFGGPDPRDTLHDHPWGFLSLILRGGYDEVVPPPEPVDDDRCQNSQRNGEHCNHADTQDRCCWCTTSWGESTLYPGGYSIERSVRRFNRKHPGDVHAIVRLHRTPTWTLMLVGRRCREWGYLDPVEGWVQFDVHPHNDEFKAAMAKRKELLSNA